MSESCVVQLVELKTLGCAHTMCLCASYAAHNVQLLFPYQSFNCLDFIRIGNCFLRDRNRMC
jgi:hypothetical protein